jgi:magnesium transporter
MKLLTIFSAFFLPLTFIAGIYGMNFRYMPELEWHNGYFMTLGLMAIISIVIYMWFKRKKII